jgi:hypothetical protein
MNRLLTMLYDFDNSPHKKFNDEFDNVFRILKKAQLLIRETKLGMLFWTLMRKGNMMYARTLCNK